MAVTSNTSPIVALAKGGRLNLLKELYVTVVITPSVKVECIDRGKELGAKDVTEMEKAIEDGWMRVVELDRKQKKSANKLIHQASIGLGEAETLILARSKNLQAILDDKEARAIAKSWELKYQGTVMVLYEAFVRGKLNYDELIEELTKLSKIMWISSDVIAKIIMKAKGVKK